MEVEGFAVPMAAVQRWMPLGRDVLLRGDRGSGKTTVLEALLADASRRGRQGMLLRSSGSGPLSALLDHASVPPRTSDETALTAWLTEELAGRRSLLLIDDLDRVDAGTLAVVRRVLARTQSVLVATTTVDPLRRPTAAMREVLADRAPAEVRIPPFGFRGVANLLGAVLGAPADAGLTASVMAQTGGNPRAVVALTDAARAVGALDRVDEMWVDAGTLDEVPVDTVAHVFLSGARTELVDALELLAGLGPLPAETAGRLVAPPLLEELVESGRVVSLDVAGAGEMVGVAPPAVARAMRERTSAHRRRQLANRVDAGVGSAILPQRAQEDELSTVLLRDTVGDGDEYWRWTAELAGLIHERAAVEESSLRAAWLEAPSLRTANAYLALLMRRPAGDQLRTVFETTRPTECDGPAEYLAHGQYRARWRGWEGASPEEIDAEIRTCGADLTEFEALRDLKGDLLAQLQEGADPEVVVAAPAAASAIRSFRGVDVVVRAAALLESGRPEHAVRVCDAHDLADAQPEPRHYLAAVRGIALAMAGRTEEAERWLRRMLDAAYDAVDSLGIRVHACALAEVLLHSGRTRAAWRVVSTALRLGPAGPIETTFYRRGLTVGAILQAQAGNVTLAQVLVRELDKTPRTYHPLLRSMRVLAHVVTVATEGDAEGAAQTAWQAGRRYAEEGLLQPALMTWAGGTVSLTPARAEYVRDVLARTDIPLVEPYIQLLLAVSERDVDAAVAALPRTDTAVAPQLVRAGQELAGPERAAPGVVLTGPAAVQPVRRGSARAEPLSAREREVAVLAQEGLSNRLIADRLHLSVRTVENHMSRALRKLGFGGRADLLGWREP
ncbi:helix-turn-helix transcriptional regulator [Cellulomonas triticagri]|nr:LuxR C-terminal-related transcriptional regulator [Cellulomonas triticagri]